MLAAACTPESMPGGAFVITMRAHQHARPRTPRQGDGNARIHLDEMTLTEWFSHIDHLMPHTRISLADLSCLDDGELPGRAAACRVTGAG